MQRTIETRDLAGLLLAARNGDGGWGYYQGKATRLEPTCWAILALKGDAAVGDLGRTLRNWPASEALLLERVGGQPNYGFHALALLALVAAGVEHVEGNATLASALQKVKGLALPQSDISRQDNSLQGWSWIANTFSWVEPTAWCVLALKKAAAVGTLRVDADRINEAERLLLDRAMQAGGWNYGNSNMLGQELVPYVPTTAIALLALQDRRHEPAVARGLSYLERSAVNERSGSALALASLALRVYGRPADSVDAALREQLGVTMSLGSLAAIATVLYTLETKYANVFRL